MQHSRLRGHYPISIKIFIQASGKGTRITIEYIEMFGEDTKTGEARYEKFFP